MHTLKVTSGPAAGQSVVVEGEVVIGREGADLTIPDPEISRRHTLVCPAAGGVLVEDLGSTNGTFVDGRLITEPVTLTFGSAIRVGESEIRLERDPSATAVAVLPPAHGLVRRVEETPVAPAVAPGSPQQRAASAVEPQARPVEGSRSPRPPAEPPARRQRRWVKLALPLGAAIAAAVAAAAVLALVADSDDVERHVLAARVSATRVSFKGRRELLFGDQSGAPTGPGTTRVELTFAVPPQQIRGPTPISGRIISRFDAGSVRSTFKATVRPSPDGSARVAGRGTITGGAGDFAGASGSYALTAVVPAKSTSAQFRMKGSIEY